MNVPVQIIDEPLTATGTWMTPPQVNDLCPFEEGGVWLGRNADDRRSAIGRRDDTHVLLTAMNRGGKGRALITNNLLLWPGSVFCNDPKGENASICASRRGQGSKHTTKYLNQEVYVLDGHRTASVNDNYRAYYNPLRDLDPEDDDTPSAAEDIVRAMVTESVRKDPTWDEMAIPFMKNLILHIVTAPASSDPDLGLIPANERDLVTFRRMILSGDVNGLRFFIKAVGEDRVRDKRPDLHMLMLERMRDNPHFEGMIADYADSFLKDLEVQPKLWNSVRSAASTASAWIDDPKMRHMLREGTYTRTFKMRDLKEKAGGISVFSCLKLKDQKKYAAWPRVLTTMVMAAAQHDYNADTATGHATMLMLDEFAAMERMSVIENSIGNIAGAGIKLFMVLQSLTQAKAIYADHWEAFVSSAGTQIYYGFNDNFTAEYVSKRLGEIEVIRKMRSGSVARMTGTSIADTEGGSTSLGKTRGRTDQVGSTSSHGGGSSHQDSYGSGSQVTNGWGPSLLHLSLITSLQRGHSSQRSSAQGSQTTWQQAKQHSRSNSFSETQTDTENWSRTVTQQRSETNTEGWQEQIHRRPLAAINDLIKLFGTVEDESAPNYPGIGLVLTSSSLLDPFMVVKAYYDKDSTFAGMFDPHPKWGLKVEVKQHEARRLEDQSVKTTIAFSIPEKAIRKRLDALDEPRVQRSLQPSIGDPTASKVYYQDSYVIHPLFSVGQQFSKGDAIAEIDAHWARKTIYTVYAPSDGVILSYNELGYEVDFDGSTVPLSTPLDLEDAKKSQYLADGKRVANIRRTLITFKAGFYERIPVPTGEFGRDIILTYDAMRTAKSTLEQARHRIEITPDEITQGIVAWLAIISAPVLVFHFPWLLTIVAVILFLRGFEELLELASITIDRALNGLAILTGSVFGTSSRELSKALDAFEDAEHRFQKAAAFWPS